MSSSYLAQFYDPGLAVEEGVTREKLELEERGRLTKLVLVASMAQTIPRRLGGEATAEELAKDQIRCRRILHVAAQCLTAWGGQYGAPGEVNREAAQVQWQAWWVKHKVWLEKRVVYIATWSMLGNERWAKSAIVRLNNEREWLQYALRG